MKRVWKWIKNNIPPLQCFRVSVGSKAVESESESCSVLSDSLQPHGLYSLWNSPCQNTGVGRLSLLQGMFPTQGLKPGLPHCGQILYQLSHKGTQVSIIWGKPIYSSYRGLSGSKSDLIGLVSGFCCWCYFLMFKLIFRVDDNLSKEGFSYREYDPWLALK